MAHLLRLVLLAATVVAPAASAASFGYEGRLDDLGSPANGRYDLELRAYADARGPSMLAAPITFADVAVAQGRFRLDFDLPLAAGAEVWLELAVRDAGAPLFTPIAGRTKALEAPLIGQCWSSTGDAGTNPAVHYLGTSDAQPMVLRVRGTPALRIEPSSELSNGVPITVNLVGGSSVNSLAAGVRGATIAGGGAPTGTGQAIGPTANRVAGHYGFVGGGLGNVAGLAADVDAGRVASVLGGLQNEASGFGSVVAGGAQNQASGYLTSVGGGGQNAAVGDYSMIGGGAELCAGGDTSWAGGNRAKVRPDMVSVHPELGCAGVPNSGDADGDEGTFVWADRQVADFISSGPGQFLVRASGGLALNTNSIGSIGDLVVAARPSGSGDADADLHLRTRGGQSAAIYASDGNGALVFQSSGALFGLGVGGVAGRYLNTGANNAYLSSGGVWTNGSSRAVKEHVSSLDPAAVLARVLALPVTRWRYSGSDEGEHVGPMAEDFHAAFGLGPDAQGIATVDADGVALAAIQGLAARLEADNARLRAELEGLRQRLDELAGREP